MVGSQSCICSCTWQKWHNALIAPVRMRPWTIYFTALTHYLFQPVRRSYRHYVRKDLIVTHLGYSLMCWCPPSPITIFVQFINSAWLWCSNQMLAGNSHHPWCSACAGAKSWTHLLQRNSNWHPPRSCQCILDLALDAFLVYFSFHD